MNFLNVDKGSVDNGFIPSVFIDEVILEETSGYVNKQSPAASMGRRSTSLNQDLVGVRTTVSFKHISSGKDLPPWMDSSEFLDLLKIRAILVSDERVYNRLVKYATGGLSKYIFNDVKLRKILSETCQVQEIRVSEYLRTFKKGDYETYLLAGAGQQEMVNIPFQLQFDPMESTRAGNLYLFVYAYSDLQQNSTAATEYSKTNIVAGASSVGNIKIKPIIQNSKVVQESFLLRRADNNEIYLGDFHVMPAGTIMSGKRHTNSSIGLTKEKVPDLAIKDYRKFSHYGDRIVDLTIPKNVFVPELDRSFVRDIKNNLDNKNKTIYFSDIWMSRSQVGDCNFTFAINLKKMVLENTKFPRLLEIYPESFEAYFRVLSVKVWRRRVNPLQSTGLQNINAQAFVGPDASLFDAGFYGKSAGIQSERSFSVDEGRLIISMAGLTEEVINKSQNSIRKLNLKGAGKSGVHVFAVKDHSVSALDTGMFRYEIEVEIEDKLDSLLSSKVAALRTPLKQMENFLANASRQQTYNAKSRKFSRKFVEEMALKYKTVYDTPWWKASGAIVEVTKMMSTANTKAFTRSFIVQMCDPRTGTIESIEAVIGLMQKLSAEVSKLIDPPAEPATDQSPGSTPKNKLSGHSTGVSSAQAVKNIFKIYHIFNDDYFDASVVNNTGYDFLLKKDQDFGDINQRGSIRTVTSKQLRDRIKQESEKLFSGNPAPTLDNTNQQVRSLLNLSAYEYSFLSPSRMKIRDKADISLLCSGLPLTDDFPYKKFALAASEIANAKMISGEPMTQDPASPSGGSLEKATNQPRLNSSNNIDQAARAAISQNLVNVLANKGCVVEKFVRSEDSRPKGLEVTQNSMTSLGFKDFFSNTSALRSQVTSLSSLEQNGFRRTLGIDTISGKEETDCDKMFLSLLFNFVISDQEVNVTPRNSLSVQKFDLAKQYDTLSCATATQSRQGDAASPVGMAQLPNQVKAFLLSFVEGFSSFINFSTFKKSGDILKDPLRAYVYFFNFFNLVKIEVFDGFEILKMPVSLNESLGNGARTEIPQRNLKTRKGFNVKMPKWRLLTKKEFDSSVINGHELLCRISRYENSMIGINQIPGLRLPIFDQYFVVSPPTRRRAGAAAPASSTSNNIVANLDRIMSQTKPEFLVSGAALNRVTGTRLARPTISTRGPGGEY